MTNHIRTFGQAAVDNGFKILPVAAGDKFPATFTENTWKPEAKWERWGKRMPTAIELKLWASWPTCSAGIPCGDAIGVDIDIPNPEIAATARAIVLEELGQALERVGRRPKCLLLYRTAAPFPGFRPRPLPIEILGLGQQFVAAGTHPDGHDYVWVGDSPADTDFESLTVVTEEQVRRCCERLLRELPPSCHIAKPATGLDNGTNGAHHDGSALGPKANPEAIEDALRNIPNDDLAWDDWSRVGLAVKAAIGDAGKPLFEAWSAQASKNVPKATAKAWKGFKPNGSLGAGSIFAMAKANGWQADPDLDFTAPDDDLKDIKIDVKAMIENAKKKAEKRAGSEGGAGVEDPDEGYIYASTGAHKLDALIDSVIANATPMVKEIAAFHAACLSGPPVPIFSLGTAIMAISVAMGRNYLSPTDSTTSVGQVQIAESGGGKEAAMDALRRLFHAANMKPFIGSASPQSEGAILKDLSRHPVLVYPVDEFGDFMRKHDNSNRFGIGAIVKTLVGSPDKGSWDGGSYAGDREEIIIESPVLSILGTTTEDQLFSALSAGVSKDGFLARFLFLPYQHPPKAVKFRLTPVPAPDPAIIAFLRSIARMGTVPPGNMPGNKETPHKSKVPPASVTHFTWGPGGTEAYLKIREDDARQLALAPTRGHTSFAGRRSMEARRGQRAQQFGMVRAIADGRTDLRGEDILWGSDLWSLSIGTFLRGNAEASDLSPWGVSIQKLLDTIRTVSAENIAFLNGKGRDKHKIKKRNPTISEEVALAVARHGWVPSALVYDKYSGSADLLKVIAHCIEAGKLEEVGGKAGGGKAQLIAVFSTVLPEEIISRMSREITKPPKFYRLL